VIRRRRAAGLAGVVAGAAAFAAGLPTAVAAPPTIEQLVVLRDGTALTRRVVSREAHVRVHGARCAVASGTPLAALVRSHQGPLHLRDFGSCSEHPRDGAGLFVSGIRTDRNKGQDGWVYKVGRRAGSAGAADPAGPFGSGRLRSGARVTWFYCRMGGSGCQSTLSLRATVSPGGLLVRVTASDDRGRGTPAAGATVHAGSATATTGSDGSVVVPVAPGRVRVYAERSGSVRSFSELVRVS
jgi:hypothetical protein